jgi:hypothetical protein
MDLLTEEVETTDAVIGQLIWLYERASDVKIV